MVHTFILKCFATFCIVVVLLLFWTHRQAEQTRRDVKQEKKAEDTLEVSMNSHIINGTVNSTDKEFNAYYKRQKMYLTEPMYHFDRSKLIPLMRLSEAEQQREHRQKVARAWLKSQAIVVAATVCDGMAGLPSTVRNLRRFRTMFGASWVVFVENESSDRTRQYLYNWTREDSSVTLLGCGRVNSPDPCWLNLRHSTGRKHAPGGSRWRNFQEEIERGLIMSALRNIYLDYIYANYLDKASLLLVIDPDLTWTDWDLENIAQGLYYFRAKPKLQQLCAHNTLNGHYYDECTLVFHLNNHFGEYLKYPVVDYTKSVKNGPRDLAPVKVDSCFQAFAFYRLSEMARLRVMYKRSPGEWICEHNTVSRQLQEVYLDPQMRIVVKSMNNG